MTNNEIAKIINESSYEDLFTAYLDCEEQDKNYFVQCLLDVFTRFENNYRSTSDWAIDEFKRLLVEELNWKDKE